MIQFTQDEMIKLRKKANKNKEIIDWLINENKDVFENKLTIPTIGIGTWNLYYFCPEHSVRLDWEIDSPKEHRCPIDGAIHTGEPYDGAWWRWMNGLNAKACYHGGLLWQLTKEKKYLNKIRDILLEYSKYYPEYEEHGGIPYNGPGKANAQTLCEANCHKDFTMGYDLVSDDLTAEEKNTIETRLLREGADFLMEHRSDQLHNHEVKIGGTIGIIGLVLNEKKYLDFAVQSKYGLLYQLENGVAEDGLWFEGSVHYHYYALQGMLGFEKVAKNTKYSNLDHPNFRKMLDVPLSLILPNDEFPKLNDCIKGQEKLNHTELFEFAYSYYNDEKYAKALNKIYKETKRNNIDAFLYGVDEVPTMENSELVSGDTHLDKSGLTVFRNDNSYFLMKHTPYGGEHDHYDRMGIILYNNSEEVIHDLGTTGYGAILHYDYFKNTISHNTISINGENQPPVNPKIIDYRIENNYKLIDAEVDWSIKPPKLDSFTRVQWCEKSYKDVRYRRSIVWMEDHFIEVIKVINPHEQNILYSLHTKGVIQDKGIKIDEFIADSNPAKYFKSLEKLEGEKITINSRKNNVIIYSLPQKHKIKAKGPDNPSTHEIDYLFLKSNEKNVIYANLFDFTGGKISDVSIKYKNNIVKIECNLSGIRKKYSLEQNDTSFDVDVQIID